MCLYINVKHWGSENYNFCLEDSTDNSPKCTSFLANISIEIFITCLLTLVPYLHEMKANFTRWVLCESETDHNDEMEGNKITFVWENYIVNLIWARDSILGYYTMQDRKFVPRFQTNIGWNLPMLHGVVCEKTVVWATPPMKTWKFTRSRIIFLYSLWLGREYPAIVSVIFMVLKLCSFLCIFLCNYLL